MHVLHYLILRYHPTSLGPGLESFVNLFFGYYEVVDGIHYGGHEKWYTHRKPNSTPYEVVNNDPLQTLVNGLATLCHNQYRLKSSFVEEMLSKYTHPFLKSSEEESAGGIGDDSEPFQYEGDCKVAGGRPNVGASSSSSPAHAHPTSSSNLSLDDNLQDHTSLALLLASVRTLPWKVRRFGLGGDKAMNRFDFQDKKNRGSAFSSNFSTSEYFDLASAGPSKAFLSRQNK